MVVDVERPPILGDLRAGSRIHVVSGSFGAGHDAAAHEIAQRLTDAGHIVTQWDVVDLLPGGLGRSLRAAYHLQLSLSPRSWGLLLGAVQPGDRWHRLVVRALATSGRRLEAIEAAGADLFVSTHPFASQSLGRLRGQGRLHTPVVTYLTDMSVHGLWVHPGVDLHLALHEVAAEQARAWGGATVVVEPLAPAALGDPLSAAVSAVAADVLRRGWGLLEGERVALVVGGSWGIGDLERAAVDVRESGLAHPVVLCGHNTALRRRLERRQIIALGWRDDVSALLAAADCMVQNAGGFMSLEALACGLPVITHRALPGHGTTNAAALDRAGLARWVHAPEQLPAALAEALHEHPAPPLSAAVAGRPWTVVEVLAGAGMEVPA